MIFVILSSVKWLATTQKMTAFTARFPSDATVCVMRWLLIYEYKV